MTTAQIIADDLVTLGRANTSLTAAQTNWNNLRRNLPETVTNESFLASHTPYCSASDWTAWANSALSYAHAALNAALTAKFTTEYVAGISGATSLAKSYASGAAAAYTTCAQSLAKLPSAGLGWQVRCALGPAGQYVDLLLAYAQTAMTYAYEALALPIPVINQAAPIEGAQGALVQRQGALSTPKASGQSIPLGAGQPQSFGGLPRMQPQVVLVQKTPRFVGSLGSIQSSIGSPVSEGLIGGALGAIVGALVGLAVGHPDYGAGIGLVVGGGGGYWAGKAGQTQNTNALAATAFNESGA